MAKKSNRKNVKRSTFKAKEHPALTKWREAVGKLKMVEKDWKKKLMNQKEEFQAKLATIQDEVYGKAFSEAVREYMRKQEAKAKLLAAAEAKFEKAYQAEVAKKMTKLNKKVKKTKKSKSKTRTVKAAKPAKSAKASKSSGGKRGRPAKKAKVATKVKATKAPAKKSTKSRGRPRKAHVSAPIEAAPAQD